MTPPTLIRNKMILASAGSGKTFQLTLRFIRLLLAGAEPETVVALTFTRKAAGEFLEAILQRLAEACLDDTKRAELFKDLKLDPLPAEDLRTHLAKVISRLHRLRLGTLDSFFHGFIQAYGLELGLPGSVDIVDGFQLNQLRRQVWSRMFEQATGAEQRELMQICNENAWGDANKQVASAINDFIDQNHHRFIRNPDLSSWSDPYAATNQRAPWPKKPANDYDQRLEALASRIEAMDWKPKVSQDWLSFFEVARSWQWGQPPPDPKGYILKRLLEQYGAFDQGEAVLKFMRAEIPIDLALGSELKWLIDQFVGSEWQRARRHTELTHRLLERYEAAYQDRVRRQGRLTFSDMPLLLTGLFGGPDPEWAFYRMDGRIEHWLLDEFQDTSREQWEALKPLIDEVLQDPSESRTLFYVGDVKQSIYGWRGGDPLLFSEIKAENGERIEQEPLFVSYRSNWPILRLVNAVCGNFDYLQQSDLATTAVKRWQQDWKDHEPAARLAEVDGECRIIAAEDSALEIKVAHAIELIRQIQPIERGLSCAILTLKNSETDTVVNQLRQAGIDCAREGEAAIGTDNLPGRLLRALFQVIAHPEDSLSLRMLEMSPIRWPDETESFGLKRFIGRIHREAHRNGYAVAAKQVLEVIRASVSLDEFNAKRCQQLLDAARSYDSHDLRTEAGFVDFLASVTVRESSDAGRIEVMTIHKSKGLGFDVVILPQLSRNKLDSLGSIQFLYNPTPKGPGWVFKQPPRPFAELDPHLKTTLGQLEERECFERFCQLYVALTRAKRALYLILSPAPKTTSSANFENWIRESLPPQSNNDPKIIYQDGNPAWATADRNGSRHSATSLPSHSAPQLLSPSAPTAFPPSPSIVAETPSAGASDRKLRVAEWFRQEENALEKGTRLHDQLAQIEWLDDAGTASDLLQSADIRALFKKPGEPCQLWRERAFDLRLQGRWVSGIFDRVQLMEDAEGRITEAVIIDFKTDAISAEAVPNHAERYRPQLQRYRQALAAITGLVPEAIHTRLAFLHPGSVIELSACDSGSNF